jgi:hypothetical protein
MNTIIGFLTSFLLVTLNFDTTDFTVIEGQRVDGIVLGESTVANAVDKFEKEIKTDRGIIDYESRAVYINRFYYSNNFVVVSFTEEGSKESKQVGKSVISEIGILYPANATTEKGINLKSDKFEKIIKIYGQPEQQVTYKNNKNLHYYSLGISFCCNNADNHIEKIAIYKRGQHPDFYYWKED